MISEAQAGIAIKQL